MQYYKKYNQHSRSQINQLRNTNFPAEMVVVIPAFNEPLLFDTLDSLLKAKATCKVAILIVVNFSETAKLSAKTFNYKLYRLLVDWCCDNSTLHLNFEVLFTPDLRRKHAGAGLARKIGMDTAIELYYNTGNEKGIIVSLDADTIVDQQYFNAIWQQFKEEPKTNAILIDFRHRTDHLPPGHKKAALQYELYLHYFVLACRYAGFPYAFHTIGSCFAVKASTYVKQGGMNKKHAGEDFYFLHKIFPLGNCSRNYKTRVYPSGRISSRVVFGTGPAIHDILKNNNNYGVYDPDVFFDLQEFFRGIEKIWTGEHIEAIMPEPLLAFWKKYQFDTKTQDALKHSASANKFRHRILHHFNAFRLVKYLNFAHEANYYSRIPVKEAASRLITTFNQTPCRQNTGLLAQLRRLEQTTNPYYWQE